jgi:transposase
VKKTRKHYTGEEKVAILRRHLLEKEAISKLCDKLGLQPPMFYRWQKEFFENGAAAFQAKGRSDHQAEQERIEYLEKKIQRKDEVLAELMGCQFQNYLRIWAGRAELTANGAVLFANGSCSRCSHEVVERRANSGESSCILVMPGCKL